MRQSLSIIIPAYNEERYLGDCLQAISEQTERPDEVILVDNNSTDSTLQVAWKYSFVTIVHEKDQGLFFARNCGMNAAKSDILARIDADTFVEPDWVASIKDAFEDPEVQAVSGPVGYHDMPLSGFVRRVEDACLRVAKAGRYDFLMGANMAVSRKAWNLVREELCNEPFLFEDIDIAVHLQDHGIYAAYSQEMRALVSARRLQDKPVDFFRYIGGHSRTWRHHGIKPSVGSYYASGAFIAAYLGIKPLHMVYDPDLRRPSLRRILQPTAARPDPMAMDDIGD
jgi:glycosyltransferase involved in cell wall biosynthesis